MTPSVPLYARPESFRGQRCTRVRLLAPSGGEADGTGAVAACGNLAARPEDCTRELADSVKPRFAGAGGGTRTPNLLFTKSTGRFPPDTAGVRNVPLSRHPRSSRCPLCAVASRPVQPRWVADRVAPGPFAAVAVTAALRRARRELSKVATT